MLLTLKPQTNNTMKELEQKAEQLIEQYRKTLLNNDNYLATLSDATKCAIQSVNHTIEVLESIKHQIDEDNYQFIINEQIELKKILEGRV